MADMYPSNQELMMNGQKVTWPGVGANGKFTNGDFNDPLVPPSFIPAESINLLLDNVGGLIKKLGRTPNNTDGNQLAEAFDAYEKAQQDATAGSASDAVQEMSRIVERNAAGAGIGYPSGKERFLTFDFADEKHRSIVIAGGVHIKLDIKTDAGIETRWFETESDTSYDLAQGMRDAAYALSIRKGEENGRNFYLYIVPEGDNGTKLVVSCNSTYPNDVSSDYTGDNTRKIGQFHTLCADAGNGLQGIIAREASSGIVATDRVLVKQYGEGAFYDFYNCEVISVQAGSIYDVITVKHPLSGFLAGEILPESVFCLTFHPESKADGMVYDVDTDTAGDIYLQSGTGANTASEFGGTIVHSRQQPNHIDDMRLVRKHLLSDEEFASMALGSNEKTNVQGSASLPTTGGHVDTAGRRMVSFIGMEDMCGLMWQWLRDMTSFNSNDWQADDGVGAFGLTAYSPSILLAGGYWNNSTICGSRARFGSDSRSLVHTYFAGRASSHVKYGSC